MNEFVEECRTEWRRLGVRDVDANEMAADLAGGTSAAEVLRGAATVAESSAESTRDLIAMRGRASYTGERSIGTLDAGAVAVALMFKRIAEQWETRHGGMG